MGDNRNEVHTSSYRSLVASMAASAGGKFWLRPRDEGTVAQVASSPLAPPAIISS